MRFQWKRDRARHRHRDFGIASHSKYERASVSGEFGEAVHECPVSAHSFQRSGPFCGDNTSEASGGEAAGSESRSAATLHSEIAAALLSRTGSRYRSATTVFSSAATATVFSSAAATILLSSAAAALHSSTAAAILHSDNATTILPNNTTTPLPSKAKPIITATLRRGQKTNTEPVSLHSPVANGNTEKQRGS